MNESHCTESQPGPRHNTTACWQSLVHCDNYPYTTTMALGHYRDTTIATVTMEYLQVVIMTMMMAIKLLDQTVRSNWSLTLFHKSKKSSSLSLCRTLLLPNMLWRSKTPPVTETHLCDHRVHERSLAAEIQTVQPYKPVRWRHQLCHHGDLKHSLIQTILVARIDRSDQAESPRKSQAICLR